MFPCLHAAQYFLLAIRWKSIKALQPLFQLLLPLRGKSPELRVAFERPPLLVRRKPAMLIQPLPGVVSLLRRLIRSLLEPRLRPQFSAWLWA